MPPSPGRSGRADDDESPPPLAEGPGPALGLLPVEDRIQVLRLGELLLYLSTLLRGLYARGHGGRGHNAL